MKNIFVWDSSSSHLLLLNHYKSEQFQFIKKIEKRSMSSTFPKEFNAFQSLIKINHETEVIVGAGPGSFTGVKTGNAFILSYLYSKNIRKIKLLSSLDLFSLFIPYYEESLSFVIFPFNNREFFISVFKWENGKRYYLERDTFMNIADIDGMLKRFNYDNVILFSVESLPESILDVFRKSFKEILFYSARDDFHFLFLSMLKVVDEIDISKDALKLNYVITPAHLKGDEKSFYIPLDL